MDAQDNLNPAQARAMAPAAGTERPVIANDDGHEIVKAPDQPRASAQEASTRAAQDAPGGSSPGASEAQPGAQNGQVVSDPTKKPPARPVIHPALYQSGFASVGIVDSAYRAWVVVRDSSGVNKCDAKKLYEQARLYPAPLAYAGIAGRWPEHDLDAFIANPNEPSLGPIVKELSEVLRYFLEFKSPEDATMVACWIVGTYFHQVFAAYPRLNVVGERRSGKTKLLQLIAAIAFNGLLSISPTPAVLFRLIQVLRPTWCLDEMEGLAGDDQKAIHAVLNAGYKAGATVARVEGEDRHVEGFEVYAPVVLASINGINAVTADRAITITMERGTDADKINRIVDPRAPGFGRIRARLYRMALTRHREVHQAASDVPGWLQGRQRELFLPLLVIATLADQSGASGVRDDVLKVAARALDERENLPDEGRALFYVLQERLEREKAETITIYPGDLVEDISFELDLIWLDDENRERGLRIEPRKVGSLLRRYGFKGKETNRGIQYTITHADFLERAPRYGYPVEPLQLPPIPTGESLGPLFDDETPNRGEDA